MKIAAFWRRWDDFVVLVQQELSFLVQNALRRFHVRFSVLSDGHVGSERDLQLGNREAVRPDDRSVRPLHENFVVRPGDRDLSFAKADGFHGVAEVGKERAVRPDHGVRRVLDENLAVLRHHQGAAFGDVNFRGRNVGLLDSVFSKFFHILAPVLEFTLLVDILENLERAERVASGLELLGGRLPAGHDLEALPRVHSGPVLQRLGALFDKRRKALENILGHDRLV